MKRTETYAFFCMVFGTLLFWGLLIYRLINEGFAWLYETSDGIIIAGLIGIAGFGMTVFDSLLKGELPISDALDNKIDRVIERITSHVSDDFTVHEIEIRTRFEELSKQMDTHDAMITEIRDHVLARENSSTPYVDRG